MNLVQLHNAYICAIASSAAYKNDDAVITEDMKRINKDFLEYHKVDIDNHTALYCRFKDFIVVAFRGTDEGDVRDWMTNLDCYKKTVNFLQKNHQGLVHEGFYDTATKFHNQMFDMLNQDKKKEFYITGHSLGGGIANCFRTFLFNDEMFSFKSHLYTFGSPRVFGYRTAKLFDRKTPYTHIRFVTSKDPVPGVPFHYLMGYKHAGRRIYINRKGTIECDASVHYIIWDGLLCRKDPVQQHHISTYLRHIGYEYMDRKDKVGL